MAYIRGAYIRKEICVSDSGGLYSGGLYSEGLIFEILRYVDKSIFVVMIYMVKKMLFSYIKVF